MHVSYFVVANIDSYVSSNYTNLFAYLQQFNITDGKYTFDIENLDLLTKYENTEALYNLAKYLLLDLVNINQMGLTDLDKLVQIVKSYKDNEPKLDRNSLSSGLMSLEPKDIPSYLDLTKDRVNKYNEQINIRNKQNNKYGLGLLALYACLHNYRLVSF